MFALSACEATKPGTRYYYYSVHGENSTGLVRSVKAHAPRAGKAYGLTEITFLPVYDLEKDGGRCRARNVQVELALKITLPQWSKGKEKPRRISGLFNRFEDYIRGHELQHVAIARRFSRQTAKQIGTMSSADGCARLERDIATFMKSQKARHLLLHKAFDKREARRVRSLLP